MSEILKVEFDLSLYIFQSFHSDHHSTAIHASQTTTVPLSSQRLIDIPARTQGGESDEKLRKVVKMKITKLSMPHRWSTHSLTSDRVTGWLRSKQGEGVASLAPVYTLQTIGTPVLTITHQSSSLQLETPPRRLQFDV